MEHKDFLNLVSRRKLTVFIITAVILIAASLLTFLQPLKYSATSTLLVVQNYGPNTDAYNVSRANQFLSNLLAQVVYSDSFYEKVMTAGYNIDKNIFSVDTNKRKREWQKMIYTRAVADTGMIILKTYHQDKKIADLINQATAYTLMTKHGLYHGLGESVQIKIINDSTLSDLPVKPNVALNLLLGLVVGLAVSLYFIYLFPDKSLGFRRARRQTVEEEIAYVRPEPKQAFNWSRPEIEAAEPEMAYGQAEEPAEAGQSVEAAGEEDEFEPFFKGNINNVIQR